MITPIESKVSWLEPLILGTNLPYEPTMARMEEAQAERKEGRGRDLVMYLEHEPVITHGRATPEEHLHASPHTIPTIAVPRGGLATYHGPGQLVGYLVVDLNRRSDGGSPDLHAFLRAVEQALIDFLAAEYSLPAERKDGFTGVWTRGFDPAPGAAPRKLASIGISCRRWVTAHGFALNLDPDMSAFQAIVPCGITDADMTSVRHEHTLAARPWQPRTLEQNAAALHKTLSACLAQELGGAQV